MRQRLDFMRGAHIPDRIGVYIIRGSDNEVLYIGSSKNLRQRLLSPHRIAKLINEYEPDDLSISLLAFETIKGARRAEKEYIKKYKPVLNGRKKPNNFSDPVTLSTRVERETFKEIKRRFPNVPISRALNLIIETYLDFEGRDNERSKEV